MKPYKFLGWLIWPVQDVTGQIVKFDIFYPGEWIYPHGSYPFEEEAKTAIRREHRSTINPTYVG